jgi:hypothetical protein
MKFICRVSLFCTLLGACAPVNSVKQPSPYQAFYDSPGFEKIRSDINLINSDGRGFRLFRDSDKEFVVVSVFQTEKKKELQARIEQKLAELEKISQDPDLKTFEFKFVSLDETENRDLLKAIEQKTSAVSPLFSDPAQVLALDFHILNVPDLIVIHRISKRIIAHLGNPSGEKLKQDLQSILQKKVPPPTAQTNATKLLKLNSELTAPSVSYKKEIAPLLIRNCIGCHRTDGPAPWAMTGYPAISEWKKMIREVLLLRRMPPAQTDDYYGSFKNEQHLSTAEMRKLIRWIDLGAPNDAVNGHDPLTAYHQPAAKEFPLGPPDLIIPMPARIVKATDNEKIERVKLEWPLDTVKRVRALDYQTDTPKATHHLSLHFLLEDPKTQSSEVYSFAGAYYPGFEANFLPFKASYPIPAKAPIRASMHTVPTGKEENVHMRVGIYFDKNPKPAELVYCSMITHDFDIAPYDNNYSRVLKGYITEDIHVIEAGVHMHSRGRSSKITAELPDKSNKTVISFPNYHYGWQKDFLLKKPLFLPKGSLVTCEGHYDNSEKNPFVRDGSKHIGYGWQNDQEMLICNCFGLRDQDYKRMTGKSKAAYVPLANEAARTVIKMIP